MANVNLAQKLIDSIQENENGISSLFEKLTQKYQDNSAARTDVAKMRKDCSVLYNELTQTGHYKIYYIW